MIKNNKLQLLLVITISMMSCSVNLNPKENRLFVVEEKKVGTNTSFFWFMETGQITHEGLSYFQITDDRCKLSTKQANGYCIEPIQVYEIKDDTIFILTQSEIVPIKINERYKIKAVPFSIELYEVAKRPNKGQQYFLDSMCPNKK